MNKQRGWQTRIMQKVISDINQAASIQYETDIPYKKDISEEDFILSNDYSSGDCYIDEEYTLISDKPWRSRAGGFIEYKMSEHEYNINITKIKKYFSKMGVNIEYNQVLDIYYFKTVHFDDKNEIKNSAIVLSSIRYDNNKMILSIKFKGEEK
ncbi:MAG: hypothetical protein Q3996_01165 [Candidatus Saccharibacteria bacterium]|nr:hypothetical protein [Candidatus Saccharibacteria bacterium]